MPKKFTQEEKTMIRSQIVSVSQDLFQEHGYHKTSIESIAYHVGIAKGSFYKFFNNKASLFFYIIQQLEMQLHEEGMKALRQSKKPMPLAIKEFFLSQVEFMSENSFFKELSDSTFIHELMKHLPPSMIQESMDYDLKKMTSISKVIQASGFQFSKPYPMVTEIFRNLAILYIHLDLFHGSKEVAEFYLDSVLDKLIVPMEQ